MTGRVRIYQGASLRIDQLRAEDQGWYECRVLFLDRPNSDDEFQNGTWIHLTVNSPPTFQETPPAFIEVQDREPLTLTCSAAGNPRPVVAWKRDNQAIQGGGKVQDSDVLRKRGRILMVTGGAVFPKDSRVPLDYSQAVCGREQDRLRTG
ncbi:UNVERIFIED_CONTAM: hypothetical protein K2H54_016853 [Gekko kuhli]